MNFTLEEWAAFAEIVGVFGVIITLAYLSKEIRQNSRSLHSATAQAIHDTFMQGFTMLCTDDELNRVYRVGIMDPKKLNEDELAKFFAFLGYFTASMHNAYYQQSSQAVDTSVTRSFLEGYQQVYQTPGFKMYWPLRKHFYSDEFVEYVEEIMNRDRTMPEYKPFGAGLKQE